MVRLQVARPFVPRSADMFDEMFRRLGRFPLLPTFEAETVAWAPAIELTENEGEFVVTAELPGVKLEDVELMVEKNVLTLKGKKEETKEEKTDRYYVSERQFGEFERYLTLPHSVEADKIRAGMKDGVLTVYLPKTKEAVGHKIAIKAG